MSDQQVQAVEAVWGIQNFLSVYWVQYAANSDVLVHSSHLSPRIKVPSMYNKERISTIKPTMTQKLKLLGNELMMCIKLIWATILTPSLMHNLLWACMANTSEKLNKQKQWNFNAWLPVNQGFETMLKYQFDKKIKLLGNEPMI